MLLLPSAFPRFRVPVPTRLGSALALSISISLLLPACDEGGELAPEEPATPTSPEEVTLLTDDGKAIAGTFQAAMGVERGPGVLLLHQVDVVDGEGHDRHDWDGVFEAMVGAGISTLAIDFRSHGASDFADVPIFDLGSERDQLQLDVMAGLDYLDDRNFEIGADLIGVAGLGLGGTMAVVALHESPSGEPGDWGADAVAAVSGRRDRAEDLNLDGDPTLSLRDGFYVAGIENALDSESATHFHSITQGEARLLLQPGTDAHGADLLAAQPAIGDAIVDWFDEVLVP